MSRTLYCFYNSNYHEKVNIFKISNFNNYETVSHGNNELQKHWEIYCSQNGRQNAKRSDVFDIYQLNFVNPGG
jgi:hypothetical protein